MKPRKACVVIVTYNGIQWIEKCLNSVDESDISLDILVVDNGSTDGTAECLRNDKRITYLHETHENLGFGKANNIGLRYGYKKGYDYFLLLNQDAWIEQNVVAELIKCLDLNPHFGIVSPLHFTGGGDKLDHLFQTYLERSESYQKDKRGNAEPRNCFVVPFVNAACWMLRRETLEKVGVFHPLFEHYGEDDNYIDRLHEKGLQIGIVPTVKIFHDRDNVGINPIKDDPRRLYKRTLLQEILKTENVLTKESAKKKAKALAQKMARRIDWIKRPSFFAYCRREFLNVYKEVMTFRKERQAELDIN